jgi:hypothetical protein
MIRSDDAGHFGGKLSNLCGIQPGFGVGDLELNADSSIALRSQKFGF